MHLHETPTTLDPTSLPNAYNSPLLDVDSPSPSLIDLHAHLNLATITSDLDQNTYSSTAPLRGDLWDQIPDLFVDPDVDYQLDKDPDKLITENIGAPTAIHIADLKLTQQFIKALQNATLDNDCLDAHILERLHNFLCPRFTFDKDHIFCLSLDIYLINSGTVDSYKATRDVFRRCSPNYNMLSYEQIKR